MSNFENINDGYERLMEADRYHQLPIKLHVLDHWKNKSIEYYNKAKQLDLGAAIINYIKVHIYYIYYIYIFRMNLNYLLHYPQ